VQPPSRPKPADTELSTTGGTSDGRFIAQICPQVIELGPPNASIHKIDEHIAVADIEPLKNIYRRTLENLNARRSRATRHANTVPGGATVGALAAAPAAQAGVALATAPPTPTTRPPGWCCGAGPAAGQRWTTPDSVQISRSARPASAGSYAF
jgi:hypothetical protein